MEVDNAISMEEALRVYNAAYKKGHNLREKLQGILKIVQTNPSMNAETFQNVIASRNEVVSEGEAINAELAKSLRAFPPNDERNQEKRKSSVKEWQETLGQILTQINIRVEAQPDVPRFTDGASTSGSFNAKESKAKADDAMQTDQQSSTDQPGRSDQQPSTGQPGSHEEDPNDFQPKFNPIVESLFQQACERRNSFSNFPAHSVQYPPYRIRIVQ